MSDVIHLKAVGDIMLGDHPVCMGHGVRSSAEKFGLNYIFQNIREQLSNCDLLFGNLESVLSDIGMVPGKLESMEIRGKREFASILSSIGFNVLSFANNHALQHGLAAFNDTVNALSKNRIECIGLNNGEESNVFNFDKGDVRLSIVGFSLRPEKFLKENQPYARGYESKICSQVSRLKASGRLVVVSLHWGEEYINYPSIEQIMIGRKIIDSGACLILGHHPHVLQGVELYKGALIVYSLGNFIFDKWQKNPRETMLLSCRIDKKGLQSHSILPIFINKRYQPTIANSNHSVRIKKKIEQYSQLIAKMASDDFESAMEQYKKAVEKAYLKFRIESYIYFVLNIYKYKPSIIQQSLYRFLYRRIETTTH